MRCSTIWLSPGALNRVPSWPVSFGATPTMARDHLYNQPLLAELHSELPATLFAEAAGWAAEQTLDSAVRWLQHDEAAPPLALCVHNLPPTP